MIYLLTVPAIIIILAFSGFVVSTFNYYEYFRTLGYNKKSSLKLALKMVRSGFHE